MVNRFGKGLRAYAERDGRGYPDWALRYLPLAHELGKWFRLQKRTGSKVLEIGANTCGLFRFSSLSLVALNRSVRELKEIPNNAPVKRVVADATRMPFLSGVFDAVVCVDTLEHLADAARLCLLDEMARLIGKTGIGVLTFPSGQAALEAERRIADRYYALTGRELSWLTEHLEKGLPDVVPVRQRLESLLTNTHVVRVKPSTPVWVWGLVWSILLCGWPGRGNALFQVLLRVLTPMLTMFRAKKSYRVEIWMIPKPMIPMSKQE